MIEDEKNTSMEPVATAQKPANWGFLSMKCGGEFDGEDEYINIHMTYPTFIRHVEDYLRRKGISTPTNAQIINTGWYLSQVACWHTCTDLAVEITRKSSDRTEG